MIALSVCGPRADMEDGKDGVRRVVQGDPIVDVLCVRCHDFGERGRLYFCPAIVILGEPFRGGFLT